jgi:hypothetical protein
MRRSPRAAKVWPSSYSPSSAAAAAAMAASASAGASFFWVQRQVHDPAA